MGDLADWLTANDGGRNRFVWGAGTAAQAAALEPSGWPLAGLLTSMISRPEAMRRGAHEWNDEQEDGSTSISALRAALKTEFDTLDRGTAENGNKPILKGEMRKKIGERFTELDTQLANFENSRKSVGASLNSAADLYDAASWVSTAIGSSALAVAWYSAMTRAQPVTLAASRPFVLQAMSRLGQTAQRVVGIMMKTSWKVSAIFAGASYYIAGTTHKFPGMEAVQLNAPEFTRAKVAFDPSTGGLRDPDPDLSEIGKTDMPGFLPPISI